MAQSTRTARNSALNLVAFLLGIAANILTLPLVLIAIGPSAFGVAGLVLAVVAPMTALSTSIALSTARTLASGPADDVAGAREVVGSAALLALAAALGGGLLVVLAGPAISSALFRIDASARAALPHAFAIAAIGWSAQLANTSLQSLYVAAQNYARIAQVNALGTLSSAAAIIIVTRVAPTFTGYLTALTAGYLAVTLLWLTLVTYEKRAILAWPRWHRSTLAKLTSFGGWQVLTQLSGVAATQADRYLLGAFVRLDAVGYYTVAQRLEEVAYIGVAKVGEVLFPVFSAETASAVGRRADLYARAAWLMNITAACVLGPLLAIAHDLLLVWTSAPTADHATPVLVLLTVAGLLGCGSNVFGLYALGSGQPRLNALLGLITALAAGSTSAVLLPRYGLAAAGAGSVVAMLIQFSISLYLTRRLFGTSLPRDRMVNAIVVPIAVGLIIGLAAHALKLTPAQGWIAVASRYMAVAILIASVNLAFGALSANGRRSLGDVGVLFRSVRRHGRGDS
jgi:O-antigen/teichoic acid export membrane protein